MNTNKLILIDFSKERLVRGTDCREKMNRNICSYGNVEPGITETIMHMSPLQTLLLPRTSGLYKWWMYSTGVKRLEKVEI